MEFIDLKTQYKNIENKIQSRFNSVMDHGKFIMGPEVSELEGKLAVFSGAKHAITCANGTDALTIALDVLGIKEGDEVISSPFTFFSTGETIALRGAKLVFVDINPDTYNIDENLIEEKITSRTKAIIPVSLFGQMSNMEKIMDIARKHNLYVIEDAAQSFGAEQNGKKSCSMATISTTSFFPAKPLGCYGDGGALFTNDSEIAQKIREVRNHGQEKKYTHTSLGYNSRLDTIQAAVLLEKLSIFPKEIELRGIVAKRYCSSLEGKVKTPFVSQGHTSVFAQYTIELENRDDFILKMKGFGVPTAVYYPIPIHKQPIFKELGYGAINMPLSMDASSKVVSLPMHPYLEESEQEFIVDCVLKSFKN